MEFDCTKKQFKHLEEMIQENDLESSFARNLLLVLLGVKPGCSADRRHIEGNEESIKRIGLKIKKVELGFSEIPDQKGEDGSALNFFIAGSCEKLDILNERYVDGELDQYRRDFGLFCGFPEEDVDWFLGEANGSIRDAFEELEKSEYEHDDFGLVNYVPRPCEENVEEAERISRTYERALLEADKSFDSDIGENLIGLAD
jgi:hypothetical protein